MIELLFHSPTTDFAVAALVVLFLWGVASWRRQRRRLRYAREREARRGLLRPDVPRRSGAPRIDPWENVKQ